MSTDDEIRAALESRADALAKPPPTLESIHRHELERPRGRRGFAVAAAVLVVIAVAAAVAWRDQTDTSSVTTGTPAPEEPALPDPATVAYIPSFISDASVDVSKQLDLTRTERGYRLVATTTTGTYTFTFTRAAGGAGTTNRFGTSAAFSYGTVETTARSMRWSDAVGTVSVTVSDSARSNLERVAQSLILVDLDSYEAFLANPDAPVRSSSVQLMFGDVDAGTVRWDGEITTDGVLLSTTGKVSTSSSALLGVTGPADLGTWKAGSGAYQLLRVPADFDTIDVTKGTAEIAGTITDPTVGPLVLLHSPTLEPVEYKVIYTGDRRPDRYSMCVECD